MATVFTYHGRVCVVFTTPHTTARLTHGKGLPGLHSVQWQAKQFLRRALTGELAYAGDGAGCGCSCRVECQHCAHACFYPQVSCVDIASSRMHPVYTTLAYVTLPQRAGECAQVLAPVQAQRPENESHPRQCTHDPLDLLIPCAHGLGHFHVHVL